MRVYCLFAIDGTNEYVQGTVSFPDNGIYPYGIHCVTVLVGVFDRMSGEPLIGVINQPFCHLGDDEKLWYGRCIWGLALGDCKLFDIPSLPYTRGIAHADIENIVPLY